MADFRANVPAGMLETVRSATESQISLYQVGEVQKHLQHCHRIALFLMGEDVEEGD